MKRIEFTGWPAAVISYWIFFSVGIGIVSEGYLLAGLIRHFL